MHAVAGGRDGKGYFHYFFFFLKKKNPVHMTSFTTMSEHNFSILTFETASSNQMFSKMNVGLFIAGESRLGA